MEETQTQNQKKRRGKALTVEQIQTDVITKTANMYWAPYSDEERRSYNPKIIDDIYKQELLATKFSSSRVMLLEFSQYLENYLWPNFNPKVASKEHVMSIVIMVNEKFSERVPAWETFKKDSENFGSLFRSVMIASLQDEGFNFREQTVLLRFIIHCFNSLEEDLIREQAQRLVSLAIWSQVLPGRREEMFKDNVRYRKVWHALKKKDSKMDAEALQKAQFERAFLAQHIQKFFNILDSIPATGDVAGAKIHYCERFLELMIDLTSQLPTRRFFQLVMDDAHVVVRARLSTLTARQDGKLFVQLLEVLKFYAGFEINEQTGEALTDDEMIDIHYNRITSLQKACFKHFRDELEKFALASVANIDTRESLIKHFSPLSNRKLHEIAAYLNLVPPPEEDEESSYDTPFLLELLVSRHERRPSQLTALNEMPLYPTEEIIWDENIVPLDYVQGDGLFALPKLNLQFLTLHDYLLRNFNLFRLESTYEIRQDIEDAVSRMKPWNSEDGSVYFGGWARMAQPLAGFNVVEVAKPRLGESHPARVRADVTVHLNLRREVRAEWEGLRRHDVAFLITVRPPPSATHGAKYNHRMPFVPQVGLSYVRGCEIEGMLDANGRVIEEGPEPRPELAGDTRTFRVWMDPNQYQQDMARALQAGGEDVYDTFNIFMRRKPKENNFKAVLETIRDLINTRCVVPDWLHDLLLGYGDPGTAHYSKMDNQIPRLDWNDTFLDEDHLRHSFPNKEKRFMVKDPSIKPRPPFKVKLPDLKSKRKWDEEETEPDNAVVVEPHIIPNRGPYPYNQPKKNAVPFTPTQIEAVKAGMQPGLTMVVGPPGTGKTDVAVQIISNLYHNFPTQRTLVVTHSNQALNQLFEKIMALDIDERHLLRLGHGEEALETEKDFSRYGRVNFVLQQRLELLGEVNRLQKSLNAEGDVASTCETAAYFFLYQVLARWEEFLSKVQRHKPGEKGDVSMIQEHFPFLAFFSNAPQPLFKGRTYDEDWDIAEGCFRHIKKIFEQLEEFQAFELLRSGADRTRYLLVKEAKIIAMTCTHAALKRRDLVQMGFEYDNILMEESAQILEIETFIPLLLQNPVDNHNRLKRWIMIGDHHQLPPVIKNMAFKKYSNMEQSLFTRFVRLQVPTVDLDAQGRARSSLANLYNWRYKNLGNLPHIDTYPEFKLANPGFFYDFQLIDVPDFNGVGESEPNPFFYQNLAEAEYAVAVFMYMRLLGYPAHKISILTTYNGQKHLIRDVLKRRCADNPLIGVPHKVTTVDRFQGQQNDYILLSLVRSKTVGHLRDVRRLVVAMSRARLGLYVFGRARLFQNCFELTPTFTQLTNQPLQLHLAPVEVFPGDRKYNQKPQCAPLVIDDMPHMAQFVFDFYKEKVTNLVRTYGQPKQLSHPPEAQARGVEQKQRRFEQDRTEEHPGADSDEDTDEDDMREEQKDKQETSSAPEDPPSSALSTATSDDLSQETSMDTTDTKE